MRKATINLLDGDKCYNQLQANHKEVLEHYGPDIICGYSDRDQCTVSTNIYFSLCRFLSFRSVPGV